MLRYSQEGKPISGNDLIDPLRPKGEVIPQAILEMREQIANMNWVTCPRCGYRWQYRGEGKVMQCYQCNWSVHDAFSIKVRFEAYSKKGLCQSGCGRPLSAKSKCYCDECLTQKYKHSKALIQKGLCRKGCGRPISKNSKSRCEKCLEKQRTK